MNAPVSVNLLESTQFTRKVNCTLPGNGVDVRRPFEFTATFNLMDQDEYEGLVEDAKKSEVVRAVLASVEGIPAANVNGETVEPVEVAIRNPITCDALFTAYWLYVSDDGRKAAQSAAQRKNSPRSRKR